jgi:hypothetical protein
VLYVFGLMAAVATLFSDTTTRLGTLVIAFLAYRLARHSDVQQRYQDYRALSEALRVQDAWNRSGLERASVDGSYLRMQHTELEWIRTAIRSINLCISLDPARAAERDATEPRSWITGQCRFFRRAALRDARLAASFTNARKNGIAVGVLATILAVVLKLGTPILGHVPVLGPLVACCENNLFTFATAVVTLASVFAALVSSYAEQRQFGSYAKRYQRMLTLFEFALDRIDALPEARPAAVHALAHELGREALVEQADWLLTRRERPIVLVQGP